MTDRNRGPRIPRHENYHPLLVPSLILGGVSLFGLAASGWEASMAATNSQAQYIWEGVCGVSMLGFGAGVYGTVSSLLE